MKNNKQSEKSNIDSSKQIRDSDIIQKGIVEETRGYSKTGEGKLHAKPVVDQLPPPPKKKDN